jgi:hypothetical protein
MVIEELRQWKRTKGVTDGVVESVAGQKPLRKDEEENKKRRRKRGKNG